MAIKASLPKGTRDLLPTEVRKRQYIFQLMKEVFERYAFEPIQTPAMENLTTLMGKYGAEGDKLLFKVLNNGDYLAKADVNLLMEKDSSGVLSQISKRGLRYDLTVPLARFVAMHQNELKFPFKRYQMQAVWRADRPQKGRYQEFWQCDVDVIGSDALLYEAECISIYSEIFTRLELPVRIAMNHRKLLEGIFQILAFNMDFTTFTILIDKLDKIGLTGVEKSISEKGEDAQAITKLMDLLKDPNVEYLKANFPSNAMISRGLQEIEEVESYLSPATKAHLDLDLTLARGLDYYTGCIFEVRCPEVNIGSLGGGGRYADLTTTFGMQSMSGIGVSFGADRIYDAMLELSRFGDSWDHAADILLIFLDEDIRFKIFELAQTLRNQGLRVSVYPKADKMKRMMKYANDLNVNFAGIIGSDEFDNQELSLKNMDNGDQIRVKWHEVVNHVPSV